MGEYRPTDKQREATEVIAGDAVHVMLFGGSRSGKTFENVRVVVARALAAPNSRHAMLRFRFSHAKAALALDTLPKVMAVCYPGQPWDMNRTDWYAQLRNGSQVWIAGLDDKERTERVFGQEFATIFLNECSQIPYSSRNHAVHRLAQVCEYRIGNDPPKRLRRKMLYDCNPPSQAHWTYKLFVRGIDPDTNKPLRNKEDYASLLMNPADNIANLDPEYLRSLENLPAKMRERFLLGKFASITDGALWNVEMLDRWRSQAETTGLPDMQRIVVAVDPSGSSDEDAQDHDEIGIVVCGLGVDGNGYLIEDLTCRMGPRGWGTIATTAYDRHAADVIVAETNYGGDMVIQTLKAAKPGVRCKKVTASRGKVVRAEPIASLTEQGRIRFAGSFPLLEEELCAMTVNGYLGQSSPNRADAFIWAMSELFPGIAKREREKIDLSAFGPVGLKT